jgi:hypothetical protein
MKEAKLRSGAPGTLKAVFHAVRLPLADPVSVVDLDGRRVVILRDVERARAGRLVKADAIFVYEDFEPEGGSARIGRCGRRSRWRSFCVGRVWGA